MAVELRRWYPLRGLLLLTRENRQLPELAASRFRPLSCRRAEKTPDLPELRTSSVEEVWLLLKEYILGFLDTRRGNDEGRCLADKARVVVLTQEGATLWCWFRVLESVQIMYQDVSWSCWHFLTVSSCDGSI